MAIFITAILVLLYAVWALWWRRDGRAGGSVARRSKRPRNPCKWSETGGSKGRFVEYKCSACLVVALSHTGAPPKDCKKVLADPR
ncbi:MAG: hypothetical protein AAGA08_19675 [Pseudomonadota bacterium]